MWSLRNRTSFAAERNWTRDKDGMHWWLVAIRATFDIQPEGRLVLAGQQQPPVLEPVYFGEPGRSSLRYDSDLLAFKSGTDVLAVVSAYAPRERPAATVPVALRVGPIFKELLVHGDRTYEWSLSGLTPSRPQPFLSRPIRYEVAFGGGDPSGPDPAQHRLDMRNPIGRGFGRTTSLVGTRAHEIEYPGGDPAACGPAGFGVVDRAWLPRRALAGTYDRRWEESKRPLLPDDYDPAFAFSAPVDQRTERPLAGGERVELVNMSPDGVLRFDLPCISFVLLTRFGSRREQHGAHLASVIVEPDVRQVSLVWQSALRVAARSVDALDATEIVDHRSAA